MSLNSHNPEMKGKKGYWVMWVQAKQLGMSNHKEGDICREAEMVLSLHELCLV